MGAKTLITLAAVCLAVIIAGSLVIAQYAYEVIESAVEAQIRQRNNRTPYPPPTQLPDRTVTNNVPVIHQDGTPDPAPYKPYLLTSGLTAKDDRTKVPYSLSITGRINNTGDGTAYNAVLRVVAMNNAGIALNSNYSFGGITPHMSLSVGFSLPYKGSPINNCTITPIYVDASRLYFYGNSTKTITNSDMIHGETSVGRFF